MPLVLHAILLLLLGIVFVQDLKFRAVSWLLFPMLFVLIAIINLGQIDYKDLLFNTSSNIALIGAIFLFVTIYFSVKQGELVNVSKELIGWGDLLFFICLAVFFSPINFILFFTISLIIVALGGGIMMIFNKGKQFQIPLAGLQAMMLILLIGVNHVVSFPLHLNTDEWVLLMI